METKSSTRLINFLKEFTLQKDTIRKLDRLCELAHERSRCGFEKWLQFELYLFFKELEKAKEQNVKHVDIEKIATPDKRSSSKNYFQVDLVITLETNATFGLELKTRIKANGAIQALKIDLKKHTQTRIKGKSTSNFAVVLCAERIEAVRQSELINKYGKEFTEFHIIDAGYYHFFIAEA